MSMVGPGCAHSVCPEMSTQGAGPELLTGPLGDGEPTGAIAGMEGFVFGRSALTWHREVSVALPQVTGLGVAAAAGARAEV